jgi:basic membrane protein A
MLIQFALRMRRFRACAFALAALLSLGVAACKDGSSTDALRGYRVGALLGAGGLGDQSFNDMTYAGLMRARKDFGIEARVESPEESEAARRAALDRLSASGCRLIVVSGWEFEPLVRANAGRHANVQFLVHDLALPDLPAVVSTQFAQEEGSFLAGALAGWQTRTGVVGFVGGMEHETIRQFEAGYRAGLKYANPQARLLTDMAAGRGDFSGFENPDLGAKLARSQYARGADIIFAVAGLTGEGVIREAREERKFAIGVDADQDHLARGFVLTSMMKRLDVATYEEIKKLATGPLEPGVQRYGLREGGVSLTEMKYTRDQIGPETLARLESLRKDLIAGRVSVGDDAP